ncbi:hypothetical protein P154DRAFT_581318 [Amniculicola lignicola CBS 123094]|uniref:Uncharacterized protein n=1 Tax=Amniculicola lignicola CBS 123094 TaxID=1392246 RepID=A0A6A5W455_9PLEO|nr:hypothetical protein P154DRAFT_581318 [Amniculicola lignicola CBS 123094]
MGTIEECAAPSPSPNGLTFVVEVEKAYIHLHLLSSTPQYRLFPSHRDTFNGKLGEISGPVAFGAEAYRQELQSFLQTFVKELPQVDREDIKAILGIGEGSVDLISELLEFLRITVGNDAKVYNTIDPSVVAAHGAALYARDTVLDPMYRELLDKDQHDELIRDCWSRSSVNPFISPKDLRWRQSAKKTLALNVPLLRTWDYLSGSIPIPGQGMRARAFSQSLITRDARKILLETHLDHSIWEDTPYISFTTSPSKLADLANQRTSQGRGVQRIIVTGPYARRAKSLPLINVATTPASSV